MVGPNAIPDGGRFVILQDPQKAMFAMYQPETGRVRPRKVGPTSKPLPLVAVFAGFVVEPGFDLMFLTICANGSIDAVHGDIAIDLQSAALDVLQHVLAPRVPQPRRIVEVGLHEHAVARHIANRFVPSRGLSIR